MPPHALRADALWGWDPTPGIVSVWATPDGVAHLWRRVPHADHLVAEVERFRPWVLVEHLEDLFHLGDDLGQDPTRHRITFQELPGEGELRFRVDAPTFDEIRVAICRGASKRLGKAVSHLRELDDAVLALPPEEQYLVATGRTYFRDLTYEQLQRLQFDLETTGLDPREHTIFMVALRYPDGRTEVLEARDASPAAERELITGLAARIQAADPDVIENHNLQGFDLPFIDRRSRLLGVPFSVGRLRTKTLLRRAARRGTLDEASGEARRRIRYLTPGREFIDTMDAVIRHDFSARDLPGHGLKAVAKHFGLASAEREYIRGDLVYRTYQRDPERVRRYATDDVEEVAGLSRLLGGAAFALARIAPRRYERLADAGAATGVIDPMLVRAYLRSGVALPKHHTGREKTHTGAALYLFATGVAHRVVKADVASLYPSLMRAFRIGPARDSLGALLAMVDGLVEQRLAAKAAARAAPAGSPLRFTHEATSAAMKIVVNSAYGYLAAGAGLTRFADVDAANEVTRRGRETLGLMCRELAARGVTLLEADTDGVYFAVPSDWTEADERRAVGEVGALLPDLVRLEFEGRYAAMLSHEPKNYALLGMDGTLVLKGVAFRSSRAEPFGEAFLRRAIASLLTGDIVAVHAAYADAATAIRTAQLSTYDVSSRVRLTKSPDAYHRTRESRRELPYEAMIAEGRTSWPIGERVRVFRAAGDRAAIAPAHREGAPLGGYDVPHYLRVLRENFASRLARAFSADDFDAVFPSTDDQLPLFPRVLHRIRPRLNRIDIAPSSDLQSGRR